MLASCSLGTLQKAFDRVARLTLAELSWWEQDGSPTEAGSTGEFFRTSCATWTDARAECQASRNDCCWNLACVF